MLKRLRRLKGDGLITPPNWLIDNTMYLCMMGSVAYGVSEDDSDVDVYGFCIPRKDYVFPHTAGHIHGFDTPQQFEQWQEHHVFDKSAKTEYDFTVYSIIKFFRLVMENNPNMIDALFVPRFCILHSTPISEMVRDNRDIFLHKGSWHKFRGYAYSQMSKIRQKNPAPGSKRAALVEEHGYDVKFAYHLVRLLNEAEQILVEGTLDLHRSKEQLKSIRKGEVSLEQIEKYFEHKEKKLADLYLSSSLRKVPDRGAVRNLLMDCLEQHYGSIAGITVDRTSNADVILEEIKRLVLN